MKWLWLAVLGFIVWKVIGWRKKPFAGMVSSGWGAGNSQANLPALVPMYPILGKLPNGVVALGPPGVPYGPSTTTNNGSAGGF